MSNTASTATATAQQALLWVDPHTVLSPLAGIRDLRVIQDGRDNYPTDDPRYGNSVAVMTYYGCKNTVGVRWDAGKLGFPNAFGKPTWYILPDHLGAAVLQAGLDMDKTGGAVVPIEIRLMKLEEGLAVLRETWSGTPASILDRLDALEAKKLETLRAV